MSRFPSWPRQDMGTFQETFHAIRFFTPVYQPLISSWIEGIALRHQKSMN